MLGPRNAPTADHSREKTRPPSGRPTRVYSHLSGRQMPLGRPNSTIARRPPGFTTRARSRREARRSPRDGRVRPTEWDLASAVVAVHARRSSARRSGLLPGVVCRRSVPRSEHRAVLRPLSRRGRRAVLARGRPRRRAHAADEPRRRGRHERDQEMSGTNVEPPGKPVRASLAPAFYAARSGGWRDYWTLLHPPYTAWHLSYVLLGAALSPAPDPRIVAGALIAFGLAVGVGAHAFDELNGRPLRTRLPSPVLVALGTAALLVAVALGLVAATMLGPLFLLFVIGGAAIVVLYAFEAPLVHSDVGFALGWGAFPVAATAYATGNAPH